MKYCNKTTLIFSFILACVISVRERQEEPERCEDSDTTWRSLVQNRGTDFGIICQLENPCKSMRFHLHLEKLTFLQYL